MYINWKQKGRGVVMEIRFKNIVLRDMIASDVADYVRWFTKDTQWMDFDAPWEKEVSDAAAETENWTQYYGSVKDMPEQARRWKFEIVYNGRHVGWVSSYMLDEKYKWISVDAIKEGQKVYRAVGIDICDSGVWGKGIGTNALYAFANYYFESGITELYTQTWSGNTRMIRCAEKLGFVERNRYIGTREVNGKKYDGLTFVLGTAGLQLSALA